MPEINRICLVHADPICYILATEVSREEKSTCIYLLYSCFCDLASTGNKIQGQREKPRLADKHG